MECQFLKPALILACIVSCISVNPSLQSDQLLVIGDSWAWQRIPTIQAVFQENGHGDIEIIQAETRLYASGLKSPRRLQELTLLFNNYPDATMVHLSIGGNDIETVAPSVDGTPAETARMATIFEDMDIIVDHMVSLRPDVQIFWSSYDFQRPRPTLGTPHELNSTYLRLNEKSAEYALSRSENMTYSDVNGLLQVNYGFDGVQHTQFDPPEPLPPGHPSLPNPELPSPLAAFKARDPSHLTEAGYRVLAEAQYEEYYRPLLEGDGFHINAGLNDAWFNETTTGQGFLIAVFPDIEQMFLAWFTYETRRPPDDTPSFLGEPGHRWLTAQGPYSGDTAELILYSTVGGVFDAADPPVYTDPTGVGSLTVEFADCNDAMVSYELSEPAISGRIPIGRIVPDNVSMCEALNEQMQPGAK